MGARDRHGTRLIRKIRECNLSHSTARMREMSGQRSKNTYFVSQVVTTVWSFLFLAHLYFSQVSLCDQAVSVGEWVQSVSQWVCKLFSNYRFIQTHDFDETWPQASYLMPTEGILIASKSVLIIGVYGGFFFDPPWNRYFLSSPKLYTWFWWNLITTSITHDVPKYIDHTKICAH